ncbi:MAG: methionyl-tRNA formyltransferase [Gammaproteobacteria bacterium]|nr:methionyl-tRNA formyltransferase [Gammaproteobacteria bacterium]
MNPLRIIFAGTPEFAAQALRALLGTPHIVVAVYTQPDRPAGRGQQLRASPVKALALQQGLPVLQPASLKSTEEQAALRAFAADLMVVAAYGLLLPPAVLAIPRLGCINIHASLLPRWRGAAPIQRAILAGDAETGITIMQMDAGLDTGAMLLKVACPITDDDTAASLHDKLAELGGAALLHALARLPELSLHAQAQDSALATYAAKLRKEEGRLDWSQSASQLHRAVRAYNPFPIAQTAWGDQVLRIWQAQVLASATTRATPGTVIAATKEGIDIATGDGVLRILRLQWPGGKPLSAAEFVNARDLRGAHLGDA